MTIDRPAHDTNDDKIAITPAMVDAGIDALCGFHFDDPYNKVVIAAYRAMMAAVRIDHPANSSEERSQRSHKEHGSIKHSLADPIQ